MRRRAYLAGLAGSVSAFTGCFSGDQTEQPFTERTVSLREVNREPTEYDVALSVEILESEVTQEHTAEIELSFVNEGSENVLFELEDEHNDVSEDFGVGSSEYAIVPTVHDVTQERAPGCWGLARDEYFNGSSFPDTTIAPGESASLAFELWDVQANTPCMPTGDYHFGREVSREGEPDFAWMFTLRIQEP